MTFCQADPEMIIDGFDWDRGNRAKCQKHGVSTAQIEWFFRMQRYSIFKDALHSDQEPRYQAIGTLENGRYILAVFTIRVIGTGLAIRPVSVRGMHAKEVEHYEQRAQEITRSDK